MQAAQCAHVEMGVAQYIGRLRAGAAAQPLVYANGSGEHAYFQVGRTI